MLTAEIEIEKTGTFGRGVGRTADDFVLFVPGTMPGDRVRVSFDPEAKRYQDASLLEVVRPSPDRVVPPCPVFGECGGCQWLDRAYPSQLAAKESMLRHVLERAGWRAGTIDPMIPAPALLGYRARIQLRQRDDQLGFYRARSHEIVDIESCAVAHPRLNQEIARLRDQPFSGKRKIELALRDDGSVETAIDAPHGSGGFTQINRAQNEALRRLVAERVRAAGARVVVELYCGDGNLTFPIAEIAERVVAFDSSRAAIAKARASARANADRVELVRQPVTRALAAQLRKKFDVSYDTLLVDPPRSGMAGTLGSFVTPTLSSIIYVSCSPVAFSKDVHVLKGLGFSLLHVRGIDMFPHTRHIELVASFSRSR